MKYLRKFNESIFSGDWTDYKRIDYSEFFMALSCPYSPPTQVEVEEIRTLLDEKIGVNVDYKVVVNPRHSKSQSYGTFGWSHRASIGIDMDDDFEEDDDDDNVSGLFDVYQLPKEKDDWIIVSIHETENLYFVCEDFIGLKKLIEEVF